MLQTNINEVKLHSMTSTIAADSELVEGKRIYKTSFHQTTADLGFDAAKRLLDFCNIDVNDIGLLLFGSKTPDYRSPITAAVLQGRLNLSIDSICYDINLGVNAFAQLTQIGSSIVKKTNKKFGLLIFGDTPSKLYENTIENQFLVSDAATAVLLEKTDENSTLNFVTISMGLYADAIQLKSGGFRNFNPNHPFDATEQSNYVVTVNEDLIKDAIEFIDFKFIEEFTKDTQAYYHSKFLKYVTPAPNKADDDRIYADASELPLLLASRYKKNIDVINYMTFVSIGEGLSVYGMKINHLPVIIKTAHSAEVFHDFRVSHEM